MTTSRSCLSIVGAVFALLGGLAMATSALADTAVPWYCCVGPACLDLDDGVTETECLALCGVWDTGTCDVNGCPYPVHNAACCVDDRCLQGVDEDTCDCAGGAWYHQESCDTIDCSLGRCCVCGECTDGVTKEWCDEHCGDWTPGATCDDDCLFVVYGGCCVGCEPIGIMCCAACECDYGGICVGVDLHGNYECPECPPIPTVSEWGLIVMGLLLLTGMKIRFGRRGAAYV